MNSAEALRLFGTDEPAPERRLLKAGPLSAILEDGNLRGIRFHGVEVVRAVNYLARDASWGTYAAALSNMEIAEKPEAFSVSYDGLCAGKAGRYSYRMTIRGDASGRLTLEARGVALTDFPTNRTGFVVLHPAEAAGGRLEIRHSDGAVEHTVFPKAISPDQPAFDIAGLTHLPAPGLACTVEMEGDAFEMEDQRNWADASFKTYVRPLSKPRPYVIGKGLEDVQQIAITVEGSAPGASATSSAAAQLTIGGAASTMPRLALFLDTEVLASAPADATQLGNPHDLIFRYDPAGDGAQVLREAGEFAGALGAELALEAIFDARDPGGEARALAAALRATGLRPSAILASPRREFRTRPSRSLPEGERPIGEIHRALRAEGIDVPIGLGTPSFFTEFNRNPPGTEGDFVFFSIASNVHAADDLSIMETLSVYPDIVDSARALCPGKPIWLGPCTIGMRHNPYGASVAANPDRVRKAAVADDPRHGAQFGAAFMAGAAARAIAAGVERLTLAAPTGHFGLLDDDGSPRPVHAVQAWLAAAAGKQWRPVSCSRPDIAAVAFDDGAAVGLLVANLSPAQAALRIGGPATGWRRAGEAGGANSAQLNALALGPYETAFLSGQPPG